MPGMTVNYITEPIPSAMGDPCAPLVRLSYPPTRRVALRSKVVLAASPPGACSEPMSQKNAWHDGVRRIGTTG